MNMTWDGKITASEEYKKTFKIVLIIALVNYLIISIYSCSEVLPEESEDGEVIMVPNPDCPSWQANLTSWVTFFFGIYVLIVMIRLRMAIRSQYSIPEESCVGCEDCCCVAFLGCCSLVQMAHQTADYESEEAYFLSTTGLAVSDETLEKAMVV